MIPLVRELGVLRAPFTVGALLSLTERCSDPFRTLVPWPGETSEGGHFENLVKGRVRLKPDFLAQDSEQVLGSSHPS